MTQLDQLHDRAMSLVDEALIAKRQGNDGRVTEAYLEALYLETEAAELLRNELTLEPSRSILYRSAASIAIRCKQYREAERLIAAALSGYPPAEIAGELRELLERTHFERHLEQRGVTLQPRDLQLVITGEEVGPGFALSDILFSRLEDFKRIVQRTIERKLGHPFREQGTPKLNHNYSLYVSTPRSGSFALTLRLGAQMELPGMGVSNQVISEIVQCFDLLNSGKEDQVKEIISNEPYYRNFVGLAKRIAPDGRKVDMVDLTISDAEHTVKSVGFKRTRETIVPESLAEEGNVSALEKSSAAKVDEIVRVKGRLLLADATKVKQKIQLIDDQEQKHNIIVPEGMMNDIVRPLWEDIVEVTGVRVGKNLRLSEISRVETSEAK